jgi:hypothetical protein
MSTILSKDEQKIREESFTANLILFWLKAYYSLTNKRVTGHTPNTFMGIIPLGSSQLAQPLKTVASVASSTQFFFKRLLVGLIFLGVGMSMFGSSPLIGFFLVVISLVNILNCYTSTFVVTNNAGQSVGYEISILEKAKVENFVNDVNTAIAEL